MAALRNAFELSPVTEARVAGVAFVGNVSAAWEGGAGSSVRFEGAPQPALWAGPGGAGQCVSVEEGAAVAGALARCALASALMYSYYGV